MVAMTPAAMVPMTPAVVASVAVVAVTVAPVVVVMAVMAPAAVVAPVLHGGGAGPFGERGLREGRGSFCDRGSSDAAGDRQGGDQGAEAPHRSDP
jgi:hypothetical protein